MVLTQFGKNIKIVRSDNGLEFSPLHDFFLDRGVLHQKSCVATPQQNGVVERKHQHILETARSLMFQAHLPLKFWGHAILTAVYLINRMPSSGLNDKCPFELLHSKHPSLEILRVFGSLCFACTLSHGRKKFDSRSRKCIFLGYPPGVKGYRLYDLKNAEIFISRDVIFHESIFPFKSAHSSIADNSFVLPTIETAVDTNSYFHDIPHPHSADQHNSEMHDSALSDSALSPPALHNPTASSPALHNSDSTSVPVLRRSTRQRQTPGYLKQYHHSLNLVPVIHSSHPLQEVLSYDQLSPSFRCLTVSLSQTKEPSSFSQAVKSEHWRLAMNAELCALRENETWSIVPLPAGKRPIGCKWVYKVKFRADGQIERYKARLVAKGYNQVEGFDYQETFSPVVKHTTVKVFLSLAARNGWHIHQLDVNNAFLNGDLEEEVYMEIPPGLDVQGECDRPVCLLHKSLYGLKQAARQWNIKLTNSLLANGFQQSKADYSLFTKKSGEVFVAVLVYVDDMAIASNDLSAIESLKKLLHSSFKLKDLGNLKYFLGFEVARSAEGIVMSQRKYALELLEDAGLLGAKVAGVPLMPNHKLGASKIDLLPDPASYRRLVGRLIYLTNTRPDISYAVQVLSQFMNQPAKVHLDAAHQVLRYLKGSPGQGLFFSSKSDLRLRAYADSDWAGCPDTRRSVTGFCVFFGDSLVSWKSKKQSVVARSSAEAEYRAIASVTCEIVWLRSLLKDLHVQEPGSAMIFSDNKSAIQLTKHPVFHERTKHIELDCHFIRDKVMQGVIQLSYVPSKMQIADIFTKALFSAQFQLLNGKMCMKNIYTS